MKSKPKNHTRTTQNKKKNVLASWDERRVCEHALNNNNLLLRVSLKQKDSDLPLQFFVSSPSRVAARLHLMDNYSNLIPGDLASLNPREIWARLTGTEQANVETDHFGPDRQMIPMKVRNAIEAMAAFKTATGYAINDLNVKLDAKVTMLNKSTDDLRQQINSLNDFCNTLLTNIDQTNSRVSKLEGQQDELEIRVGDIVREKASGVKFLATEITQSRIIKGDVITHLVVSAPKTAGQPMIAKSYEITGVTVVAGLAMCELDSRP
jgi:hypothetical protein